MKNVASISKAVIPAAGVGSRFWPVSKIVPKELLPIVNKPSLQLVMEEATASGVKEIILIVSSNKAPFIDSLSRFFPDLTFCFVEQAQPLGLGHAVWLAEEVVNNEPFLVLLPDVLVDHTTPVSRQLADVFQKTGKSVNAAEKVSREEVSRYGIYAVSSSDGRLHQAAGVVEKPSPEKAPSNLAVSGRYLFTPAIFDILKGTKPGRNNEIQLADAMDTLARQEQLNAYEFEGKHFDIGSPLGFIQANLHYGMKEYGNRIYKGII